MNDYDPALHITVAELRNLGVAVPADLPDQAYTLKDSVRARIGLRLDTEQTIVIVIPEYSAPFVWVELHVVYL